MFRLAWRPRGPACGVATGIVHVDAVHWTYRQTQFAACAVRAYDRVHAFRQANNGIRGTDFQAQGTANAPCFINYGNEARCFHSIGRIQGQRRTPGKGCKAGYPLTASRGALVDVGCTLGNGLGVCGAIWVAAARALGLRQRGIDAFSQRESHQALLRFG